MIKNTITLEIMSNHNFGSQLKQNTYIENSKLNYSEINLKYSGELVIYQDNLRNIQ